MNGGPKLNGTAHNGPAHGGDVEMGVRPSQQSVQNGTRDGNSGRDHQVAGKSWKVLKRHGVLRWRMQGVGAAGLRVG
jgi:hypothetical protein